MELMSSMLLCILVALPHILGKDCDSKLEIKRAHRVYKNAPRTMILNMKGAYNAENSETYLVFDDKECQMCLSCMEKAVNARNTAKSLRPKAEELHEDLLRNRVVQNRFKREHLPSDDEKTEETTIRTRTHRTPKNLKLASVTKYENNGEIYAVKVNESIANRKVCNIYSVSKSLECGSPAAAESTLNKLKKSKRSGKSNKTTSEGPLHHSTKRIPSIFTTRPSTREKVPLFKKRESYSEVPDALPSIEELTY